MVKKISALILVVVLILSFSACNNNSAQNTEGDNGNSMSSVQSSSNTISNYSSSTQGTSKPSPSTQGTSKPSPSMQGTSRPSSSAQSTVSQNTNSTNPSTQSNNASVLQGCSHDYTEATCVAPKTCKKCGETSGGTISSHNYKDATCTEPRTCKFCGATNGKAKGHKYNYDKCGVCGYILDLGIEVKYPEVINHYDTLFGRGTICIQGYRFKDVDEYENGYAKICITAMSPDAKTMTYQVNFYDGAGVLLNNTVGSTAATTVGASSEKSHYIPAGTKRIEVTDWVS